VYVYMRVTVESKMEVGVEERIYSILSPGSGLISL
jgi:hypothetical protein